MKRTVIIATAVGFSGHATGEWLCGYMEFGRLVCQLLVLAVHVSLVLWACGDRP